MNHRDPTAPTPASLLEDARELSARLGALTSLAAGMTAAIAQHTFDPDHIYLLIDGYVSSLATMQSRIEAGLAQLVADQGAVEVPTAFAREQATRSIGAGQRSHIVDVSRSAAHT
jgi:hypothetical protein